MREPIQHLAPIYNDINWYVIAGSIAFGAALLTHGLLAKCVRWERKGLIHDKHVVYLLVELTATVLSTALAGVVGYLVWHWALGMMSGLVGTIASPWLLDAVSRWLNRRKS